LDRYFCRWGPHPYIFFEGFPPSLFEAIFSIPSLRPERLLASSSNDINVVDTVPSHDSRVLEGINCQSSVNRGGGSAIEPLIQNLIIPFGVFISGGVFDI